MTGTEYAKLQLYVAKCQVAKGALQSRKANIQRMKSASAKKKTYARRVLLRIT